MSFSEDIVKQAWRRSGERCECRRTTCGHMGRCNKSLLWNSRGKESEGGWEAHHINAHGSDSLSNCEILCQSCHKKTGSYGGESMEDAGWIIVIVLLLACFVGYLGYTGRVVDGGCPGYECAKTLIPAPHEDKAIELSGKGPTIFAGTVHPKVRITNPNNEPALFKVTFFCENRHTSTSQYLNPVEIWLQPGTSAEIEGDFKVGAKENWACTYSVEASQINSCELQQI